MKRNLAILVSLAVLGLAPALAQKPAYPFNDPTLPTEKRIENLLSVMTIDEKVACLGHSRRGAARAQSGRL
jgi:beta-glucosidase